MGSAVHCFRFGKRKQIRCCLWLEGMLEIVVSRCKAELERMFVSWIFCATSSVYHCSIRIMFVVATFMSAWYWLCIEILTLWNTGTCFASSVERSCLSVSFDVVKWHDMRSCIPCVPLSNKNVTLMKKWRKIVLIFVLHSLVRFPFWIVYL